ncbi:cation diffusion facilitator family transporter [Candidatus Bathyarchaeota archaeon]|nr:cation diffusion facilitator family transporter [Candidatus Bathyarchaeota archaeon]
MVSGEKAAGYSTVITLLLACFKGVVGYLSGSVALTTDAFHSGADSITRFASWFGLKASQRKPDEKFPYGYYKAETLTALFVSAIIVYAGYELLVEGFSKFYEGTRLTLPYFAFFTTAVSTVVSLALARYTGRIGRRIGSQSLIACAEEMKIDVYSSIMVLVAVFSTYLAVPYVEAVISIVLSLMVLKVGLENAKVALYGLMDVSPSKEIERRVEDVLESCREIEEYENLKLRQAGPYVFGEVVVKMRKFIDVSRAYEISERIEERIKKVVPRVESFNIIVKPYKPKVQRVAIPVKEDAGLKSNLIDHFGRAKYLILVTLEENTVKSYHVKENPHIGRKSRAGLLLAHDLIDQGVDVLITRQIGEISFHTLRDNLVEVYLTDKSTVKEAIEEFIQGKLKRLERPTRKIGEELFHREK